MASNKGKVSPPPTFRHKHAIFSQEKAKDFKGTFSRLWFLTRGHKKGLWIILFLACLSSILGMATPYLIGRIINGINTGSTSKLLITILFFIAIGEWFTRFSQSFLMASISQKLVLFIRQELFNIMKNLPVSFFDTNSTGDIMSRLTNDIDNISSTLSDSLSHLMMLVFTLSGVFAIMVYLDIRLTLAAIAATPLVYILTRIIVSRIKMLYKEQQKSLGKLTGHIEESISGISIVKAFGREKNVIEEFEIYNSSLEKTSTGALIWAGYLMPIMNVINNLSFISVSITGGILAAKGLVDVGLISSFLLYARQFTRPINELAGIFNVFQTAIAGAERVFEIFDETSEPKDKPTALSIKKTKGHIKFSNVSFSYSNNKPVLKGLTFSVKSGEKIAIVGHTGAGKTTIINLLTRFYDVTKGSILLDGIDIREYKLKDLRSCFGIVLQDTELFNLSVADNISYGKDNATMAEIENAAKIAGADDFIKRMPEGYNTIIGGSNGDLSHGERQLMTIARAILSKAPILIMDEATSSVDTNTEKRIQEALSALMKNKTSIIIAHRLSTIKDADKIIVIDDGIATEVGTHKELMAQNRAYAKMYRTQLGL